MIQSLWPDGLASLLPAFGLSVGPMPASVSVHLTPIHAAQHGTRLHNYYTNKRAFGRIHWNTTLSPEHLIPQPCTATWEMSPPPHVPVDTALAPFTGVRCGERLGASAPQRLLLFPSFCSVPGHNYFSYRITTHPQPFLTNYQKEGEKNWRTESISTSALGILKESGGALARSRDPVCYFPVPVCRHTLLPRQLRRPASLVRCVQFFFFQQQPSLLQWPSSCTRKKLVDGQLDAS